MDSIMQYTHGLVTSGATLWFAVTFLAGIWMAARYGKVTLLPSIIAAVAVSYLRFGLHADPIGLVAILSMGGLHLATGVWIGLFMNRNRNVKPT
ncbi:MAG: hypothetical protein SGJ27_17605 [Candidatus Melainabacteria bacterium]|nr:hypothetical protein [Candidatus Melainabacteria bacterium]